MPQHLVTQNLRVCGRSELRLPLSPAIAAIPEFVERLSEADGTRAIVEAVISMARHLGLSTVAEGVETSEQHHIVKQAGGSSFQGYLFAPPLSRGRGAALCAPANRDWRGLHWLTHAVPGFPKHAGP